MTDNNDQLDRAIAKHQARVSSAIEGYERDSEMDAMVEQMERDGVSDEEQRVRIIAHYQAQELEEADS